MRQTKKLKRIHKEAIARFKLIQDAERDQRALAVEDMQFVNVPGGQWDEEAVARRGDRPRYTINRIAGAIDQLIGDQRQNRTQIKVRPDSDDADEDTAEIYAGLIRSVESLSMAENCYDSAFDEVVTGGYGGWRILTEFNNDDTFDQDIYIRPIPSAATSLFFDPSAQLYDKRDAKYAFVVQDMSEEEFKDAYPDAQPVTFSQENHAHGGYSYWKNNRNVKIGEYWVKTPKTQTIALLSDGRVINKDEDGEALDELAAQGITVERERKVKAHDVEMYRMSGMEILSGPHKVASKFIPLIPVYGKTCNIEGKTYIRGITRNAKDPQRVYNYATSAAIEASSLTPKDPYWLTAKMALGYEKEFRDFNKKNDPFMFYNPDASHQGPPARTGAPSVQQALLQQINQAMTDIHATTGLEPASLGNVPELKSGKAIQAQQAMGDRGAYMFTDNLAKSIQYTGEILADMIPKIYDTQRMVRVLGLDGQTKAVEINKAQLDAFSQPVVDQQTNKTVMVNDLTKGKYDVFVETGPAYATLRQESAAQLIELSNGNPIFQQLGTDLIAKNLNIIENDELTKRVRRLMIGQGIIEPSEQEAQELGLGQPEQQSPTDIALMESLQAETDKSKADAAKKDAETQKTHLQTQELAISNFNAMIEGMQAQLDAGIPLNPKQRDLLVTQMDIIQAAQDITQDGQPNSEQLNEIMGLLQQGQPLQQ